jgi:tRNA (guanine37-N1)-methyltransferase
MQRAHEKGLFRYTIYNLADHSVRNTRRVDDRPYGGGAGTLITIEPLVNCIRQIMALYGDMSIILMGPRGDILDQPLCLDLSKDSEQYIIICGHYE